MDSIGIKVYMWKQNNFEAIFTSDNIMSIKDSIVKVFGSRERELSMEVNDYFDYRRTKLPHATTNYGHGKYRFEINY